MVTKGIIDLFQSVKIRVNHNRDFLISPNRGHVLLGNSQEPAAIIQSGQLIDERQTLQSSFSAFAFSNVLNLKNVMRRVIVRVTNERHAIQSPDNFAVAMDIPLFNLTSWSFALQ